MTAMMLVFLGVLIGELLVLAVAGLAATIATRRIPRPVPIEMPKMHFPDNSMIAPSVNGSRPEVNE